MTWIIDAVRNAGPLPAYLIIGALVFAEDALFIGFILPGETAAVLGGVLASQNHLQLWLVLVLVVAAAIAGDTVGYQIGRHFGSRILEISLLQKRRSQLDRARDLLARKGGSAVFLGRFTAFFRAVMPALAGLSHMPYRRFLTFNIAGGAIWGAAVVLAGYFAGNAYLTAAKTFGPAATIALLAVLTAAAAAWYVRKKIKARTGHDPAAPALQNNTSGHRVPLGTSHGGNDIASVLTGPSLGPEINVRCKPARRPE
ncbi:DedA family protein [Arthrobacter sp. TB 26]|uniref:DedA family protein n=1 Tax=Arthrobacter sp. TB 26 TaxID=494420 RepID=UPI0003F4B1B0|nr:VTT domain-containing protein [Arthrobacter sp. TB 26]